MADLVLWEELAADTEGSVLDLGCGTGRVALHLARRGHQVLGLDLAEELVVSFNARAGSLPAEAIRGDARRFELNGEFGLVLVPMQLLQLLEDAEERQQCFERVAAHLEPGGLAAFAIVESMPAADTDAPLLPDTREIDGWVYSSLPLDAKVDAGEIRVRRLRQTVSPKGELAEEMHEDVLRLLGAATVEREALVAGLRPAGRRAVPATDAHVGSTVVLLSKEGD